MCIMNDNAEATTSRTVHLFRRALTERRNGLTVVECLFAMTIIIIGLFGMAFMVRFAGRQAADSYRITQALTNGENAVSFANSHQVFQPSVSQPWQLINDSAASDTTPYFFGTMERLHSSRFIAGNPSGMNPSDRARFANAVLGTAFCLDPLFWGHQHRYSSVLQERSWENIRRASFPFYHQDYPVTFNPFDTQSATFVSPRMTRISLRDPSAGVNGGWLKLPASLKLAQVSGGDIITTPPEQDRSLTPIRGVTIPRPEAPSQNPQGVLLTSIQGSETNANSTWLATMVPFEDTPVVEPTMVAAPTSGLPFLPESYELSVVVISKRDVRELSLRDSLNPGDFTAAYNAFKSNGVPPSSERLMSVSFPNATEAQTSGTFDIVLSVDQSVNANVKVGDWILLSRETYMEPVSDRLSRRSRHKWYRIIGVDELVLGVGQAGNPIVSREVRVSGAPWGWTVTEYEKIQRSSVAPPPFPATVATLISNVVNVYQRTYKVSN
jgi:hypothetical protein